MIPLFRTFRGCPAVAAQQALMWCNISTIPARHFSGMTSLTHAIAPLLRTSAARIASYPYHTRTLSKWHTVRFGLISCPSIFIGPSMRATHSPSLHTPHIPCITPLLVTEDGDETGGLGGAVFTEKGSNTLFEGRAIMQFNLGSSGGALYNKGTTDLRNGAFFRGNKAQVLNGRPTTML